VKKEKFEVMSNAEYREKGGISASDLKLMVKSMATWKYAKEHPDENDSPALLFGRAYHKLMLEPDEFEKEFIVSPKFDRRTKEGKTAYEEFLKNAEGKEVIDEETYQKLLEMKDALYATPFVKYLIKGDHEKSFFWTDEKSGIFCKCRPDSFGMVKDNHICVDLKTTSNAETSAFMRDSMKFGYDIQAAHYTEGLKATYGCDFKFLFIAQEKTAPYLVNVLEADEYFMQNGRELRQMLLEKYKTALETDIWEGYIEEGSGINTLSVPGWIKDSLEIESDDDFE
jgi:exodeoxyribonuclease VIII